MSIPKKGGYTGGRPASEMNPPAKVPSGSIRPRTAPVSSGEAGTGEAHELAMLSTINNQPWEWACTCGEFGGSEETERAAKFAHLMHRRPAPVAAPSGEDMCPNCVTPWKCNGPHVPSDTEGGEGR
jgi:hypothetical protein